MAEDFGEGFEALDRQNMIASFAVHESGGGEDMEVGLELRLSP